MNDESKNIFNNSVNNPQSIHLLNSKMHSVIISNRPNFKKKSMKFESFAEVLKYNQIAEEKRSKSRKNTNLRLDLKYFSFKNKGNILNLLNEENNDPESKAKKIEKNEKVPISVITFNENVPNDVSNQIEDINNNINEIHNEIEIENDFNNNINNHIKDKQDILNKQPTTKIENIQPNNFFNPNDIVSKKESLSESPKNTSNMDLTINSQTIDYSEYEKKTFNQEQEEEAMKHEPEFFNGLQEAKKLFILRLKAEVSKLKKNLKNNQLTFKQKLNSINEAFDNYSKIITSRNVSFITDDDMNVQVKQYVFSMRNLLGKGGYSNVYACYEADTNNVFAIKITNKGGLRHASGGRTSYDFVKDEVNIIRRLYCRYIVKTYEILESSDTCSIVMELMNQSLFHVVKEEGGLTDYLIWKYFRNLIAAVEYCHDIAKIVHRDINPNNLLLNSENIIKLSDFGVSVVIDEDNDWLSSKLGPTTYTPPEKFNVSGLFRGRPADIWCCGVTLYYSIYGDVPFDAKKKNLKVGK